jgi:hypothetical protein
VRYALAEISGLTTGLCQFCARHYFAQLYFVAVFEPNRAGNRNPFCLKLAKIAFVGVPSDQGSRVHQANARALEMIDPSQKFVDADVIVPTTAYDDSVKLGPIDCGG